MKKNVVDVTNESPEYWEKILEGHGLGTRQLGLVETEDDENPDTWSPEEEEDEEDEDE
jgi:hypothetical protein